MGRLRADTLQRIEDYSDRVLDVAAELEQKRRWDRIIDQLVGSGGSVGANAFEADQAMSAKDFAKCLGTVLKELNETKYWLRRTVRRGWVSQRRLDPLLADTDSWLRIFNRMVIGTRAKTAVRKRVAGASVR
jgi:four helix bundle protein